MNRRYKESVAFKITKTPHEDIMEEYGIEIYDDGTVYDPCDNQSFDTLTQWALYMDSMSDEGVFIKNPHRLHYDDE